MTTTARARIERVCYPLLVAATVTAVATGLVAIWHGDPPAVLARILGTAVTLALGSGWLLAATRETRGTPPG